MDSIFSGGDCSYCFMRIYGMLDRILYTKTGWTVENAFADYRTPLMDICMDLYRMGMQLLQN